MVRAWRLLLLTVLLGIASAEIWTATFGDVLRYVQERKAASVQIMRDDSSSLRLAFDLPMNKEIYDVPLTLKVEIPGVWNEVRVEGDGKPLSPKTAAQTSATVVLVDVPSQTQFVKSHGAAKIAIY